MKTKQTCFTCIHLEVCFAVKKLNELLRSTSLFDSEVHWETHDALAKHCTKYKYEDKTK